MKLRCSYHESMPVAAGRRMVVSAWFALCSWGVMVGGDLPASFGSDPPPILRSFLAHNCADCHEGDSAEGDLDVTSIGIQLAEKSQFDKWVRLFDRVHDREMPPADADAPDPVEMQQFLVAVEQWLREYQQHDQDTNGRVQGRRLTNLQLERTLQDLLGIDIPLANQLPDDPRTGSFSTVAQGQVMSHYHLERQLAVIDAALDEAFRRATSDPDEWNRTLDARTLSRTRLISRTREPEYIDERAVTWSSTLTFFGRMPATTAREDGWYRFVMRASALNAPADHGVWCTVRSGKCVSSAPLFGWVGAFEADEELREVTFETWLPKGHMLEVRPGDATLKMARFAGGQAGTGEGGPQKVPGVAIESIRMERIHLGPDNEGVCQLLFDYLSVSPAQKRQPAELNSPDAPQDITRLLQRFASRAFRRPVTDDELAPFIQMSLQVLADSGSPLAALRAGYRAVLCSPRFLYYHEAPGGLDSYGIASRLSYLFWNSMPDEELSQLASDSRLRDPQVIRAQVDRMLADPRGRHFVEDFAAEWLDLRLIDFTEPDRKLFPDFDVIVQQSMLDETHAFLADLFENDRSVSRLIDSPVTFLNSRLGRYYDIDGVDGDHLRSVSLRPEDHRGGLLTQGAVLKVTANGTTTSPVIRGVWIAERVLGQEIPPPPSSVPAVEPDIRGTHTIREMLDKHRADTSCAACHVKIDPPGFALENFDPAGQWRDTYVRYENRKRNRGAPIDASYTLADGRGFENINGFRQLVLDEPSALARNVAEQLLTYGTGVTISFADRPAVDDIVLQVADADYGMRSLLYAVVTSPLFLTK